jgi:hypothetical protein
MDYKKWEHFEQKELLIDTVPAGLYSREDKTRSTGLKLKQKE